MRKTPNSDLEQQLLLEQMALEDWQATKALDEKYSLAALLQMWAQPDEIEKDECEKDDCEPMPEGPCP